MAVLHKHITLVVIATQPGLAVFQGFYSYLPLGETYPTRLEQLLKYPVGGGGVEPLESSTTNFTPRVPQQTTSVNI